MKEKSLEGWGWASLDELSKFIIGGDWGKDPIEEWGEEYRKVACIRGSEIRNWNIEKGKTASIRQIKKNSLEKRQLIEGDILVEISGGGPDQPVGRVVRVDDEVLAHNSDLPKVATNFMRLLRLVVEVDSSFILQYLQYFYYSGKVVNYQGGSNNLRNLKYREYSKIEIPVPPLPEQKRIVAKLDALFGHLDTLKARLDKIPRLLKDFRQQVLSQAVSGKLTGVESMGFEKMPSPITIGESKTYRPNGWEWMKLIEIANLQSGHTPRKSRSDYWENGDIPWISLQDIRAAHGKVISSTKFMPNQKGIDNSSARLLPPGTVCFSRDISVGFTTVMGVEMATTQHFANWICSDRIYNMYLLYAFLAARDYLINEGKGTTVRTIYMPALKEFRILLPPIEEQHQIVSRVESLFAIADNIEAKYQSLKAKIDDLPQAILHKAFKGELVPQDPNDEPASVLLERIRREQAELARSTKKLKKKGTKPVPARG